MLVGMSREAKKSVQGLSLFWLVCPGKPNKSVSPIRLFFLFKGRD